MYLENELEVLSPGGSRQHNYEDVVSYRDIPTYLLVRRVLLCITYGRHVALCILGTEMSTGIGNRLKWYLAPSYKC